MPGSVTWVSKDTEVGLSILYSGDTQEVDYFDHVRAQEGDLSDC